MTNPLIEKFYELHPEKKEKPKPQKPPIVEYVDNGGSTPSQEVIEKLRQLQPNSNIISSISTSPKPPSLTSYDPQSGEDSFLQIAEKVKNKDARVTSVSIERDMSIMSITTVTFEVQMWDT